MHQNICCLFQTHANDFSGQPKYRHTPKHTHGHISNLLHVPWCRKLWFFTKGLEARNIFSNFPFWKTKKILCRLSSPWVITSHLQQRLLLSQNQTWQWGTLSCANLLVVSCLKLKELGCVVDEGEENHTYYVSTSLAHVPLGIIFFCFSETIF